jgi:uncharacterized protein
MSERIIAVDVRAPSRCSESSLGLVLFCGIAFFVVQYFFSRAWLARFSMGPVEWLWRALTYFRLRPQPAAA